MGEISFSEADGVPEHLDINGEFLAVVTSKGVIQIYDVRKPKEPKATGAAGKFNLHPVGLEIVSDTGWCPSRPPPLPSSFSLAPISSTPPPLFLSLSPPLSYSPPPPLTLSPLPSPLIPSLPSHALSRLNPMTLTLQTKKQKRMLLLKIPLQHC